METSNGGENTFHYLGIFTEVTREINWKLHIYICCTNCELFKPAISQLGIYKWGNLVQWRIAFLIWVSASSDYHCNRPPPWKRSYRPEEEENAVNTHEKSQVKRDFGKERENRSRSGFEKQEEYISSRKLSL